MITLLLQNQVPFLSVLISSTGVVIAVWGMLYKTNQARKKEIEHLFEKKVDKDIFLETMNTLHEKEEVLKIKMVNQENRLDEHNERNNLQFINIEKNVDSMNKSMKHTIDKIEETRMELGDKIDRVFNTVINLLNTK